MYFLKLNFDQFRLLFVQYGYIVFLVHIHNDSIVRSRRPVVVPVQCSPTPKTMTTPNSKSRNGHYCRDAGAVRRCDDVNELIINQPQTTMSAYLTDPV